MEISDLGSATAAPAAGGTIGGTSLAETFDNFLLLLTTQLQYQDPLSPMDSNQFTEQLVQFAGVEQTIAANAKLDELIAIQGGGQLSSAVSYIGREIKADGEMISLQNGTSTLLYALDRNAAETTIRIMNENGQTVRVLSGETAAGLHELVWDGKDDNGADQPEGVYGIVVTATGDDGETVSTASGTLGRVTGVETQDGEVFLRLGELLVPLEQVFAVDETFAADEV